jgi:hypothetical protein
VSRTFVDTVAESPSRVVIEDVRSGRHAVVGDLAELGRQIARLLEAPVEDGARLAEGKASGVSES